MIHNIDYHITDKCNLNCVSCGHFCPLVPASTKHKSLHQIYSDLSKLKYQEINGLEFDSVTLTGGEVTLHPDLGKILSIAGSMFGDKLIIWSNGLLYKKLTDLKDIINKYQIKVRLTNYNQPFSKSAINELSSYFDISCVDRSDSNSAKFNYQFFKKSKCTTIDKVKNCISKSWCVQLVDGRLYPCQYLAYIGYLLDYFKGEVDLRVPDKKSISIDSDISPSEINLFINSFHADMCLHCMDYMDNRPTQEWSLSNKKLSEWYENS